MDKTIAPVRGLSRRASLAAGAFLFLAILFWGFGAFTPESMAYLPSANGPLILLSLLIDTATDVGVVGLWLAAAYGYGRVAMSGCHGLVRQAVLGVRTRGGNESSALPRPGPDRGTRQEVWPKSWRGDACVVRESRSTLPGDACVAPTKTLFDVITATALGIGVIGFLVLAIGLCGFLGSTTAWAIVAGGIALLPWRKRHAFGPWLKEKSPGASVAWLLAVPVAVMVLAASVPPGFLWKPLDPHPYDVVSYHLQIPREWFELGRIVPLPHNSFSYFPAGQEMHSLLMMHLRGGPWAGMYACQMVSVAFATLAVLGVVGAVRIFGGGATIAWAAGLLTAGVPWTLMLGSVAYVESGVMLYATLGVVWAMRAIAANRPGDFVIAGVCAGMAGGIKYTALAITAVPLLLLWPLLAWPTLGRRVLRPWLIGGVACVLVVSPWLIRNVVWTGNPVFPLVTDVFGRGLFTTEQVERYEAAHAPPAAERSLHTRLSNGWDRVVVDPQSAYGLVPLTIVAMVLMWRSPAGQFGAAVLVTTTGVWLLATHTMPRFLAPAIPLAVVLIGLAAIRARSTAWAGGVAMILVAAFGLTWTIGTLSPRLAEGRAGLFRLPDLTAFEPPELKAVRDTGGRLALVGDAQAFFYGFPADRLKYRGVFDVVVPPGATLADGWLGEPIEKLRADGWWVLVAPSELVRLSKTYRQLPPATPPFDDERGPPVVLPPTGVGR